VGVCLWADTQVTQVPGLYDQTVPPNVLTQWQLSPPCSIESFDAVTAHPARQLAAIRTWITPEVDDFGLVNIRPQGSGYST
jgi:hypothetical protein